MCTFLLVTQELREFVYFLTSKKQELRQFVYVSTGNAGVA
jgi:hypothetical protein